MHQLGQINSFMTSYTCANDFLAGKKLLLPIMSRFQSLQVEFAAKSIICVLSSALVLESRVDILKGSSWTLTNFTLEYSLTTTRTGFGYLNIDWNDYTDGLLKTEFILFRDIALSRDITMLRRLEIVLKCWQL